MSLNTLETSYVNGQIIDASHINELTLSLLGQFVGRDANGVPTPNQSLGTLAIPWGNLYANGIILDGQAVDTSQITSLPNRIVSGKTRPLSSMSDFIRANGGALEFTVEGDAVDLVLSINNTAVSVSTDLVKAGIVAGPSANNTADVNDTGMASDFFAGEDGSIITIDNVGSEFTTKVGQIIALKGPANEIFTGVLKNTSTITNVFRGYYLDSAGTPIKREALSNNDTITLLNIGWVFLEDNGTTIDVSYATPVIAYEAPNSPATGQYWFDIQNQVWKRYSGTSFEIIDRILIGQVVADDTAVIASRSFDFSKQYDDFNNAFVVEQSDEIVTVRELSSRINVYGFEVVHDLTKLSWNITTDLETGLIEAPSTQYYCYVSDEGQPVISDQKPYERLDLKGFYHPYESWRCIAKFFNNSSSDIEEVHQVGKPVDNFVGSIITMPTDYIPDNCLGCDGSSLRRAEFPELFNAIGTRFGTASAETFNIPDIRGRFMRGWANGSALDPDRASRTAMAAGGATGDNVGTVQSDENKSHFHSAWGSSVSNSDGSVQTTQRSRSLGGQLNNLGGYGYRTTFGVSGAQIIANSGGNESRPENIYVNFVIKYR